MSEWLTQHFTASLAWLEIMRIMGLRGEEQHVKCVVYDKPDNKQFQIDPFFFFLESSRVPWLSALSEPLKF